MSTGIKTLVLIVGAGLSLLLTFVGGCHMGRRSAQALLPADTVYVTHTDTCFLPSPPDSVTKWKDRLVYVPKYIHDTDTIHDTIGVMLRYEQHFAKLDDVADVWFSGYDARIDSALVFKYHTTETIHQPYEVPKMPHLTLGVGVGAMYSEKRVNPYIFGEMRYNAPKLTVGAFGVVNNKGGWGAGANVSWRCTLYK